MAKISKEMEDGQKDQMMKMFEEYELANCQLRKENDY